MANSPDQPGIPAGREAQTAEAQPLAPARVGAKDANRVRRPAQLTVSYVADATRRHPGEELAFFVRVDVRQPLAGYGLEVRIPAGLHLRGSEVLAGGQDGAPDVYTVGSDHHVVWTVDRDVAAGSPLECRIWTRVDAAQPDSVVVSRAVVTARDGQGTTVVDQEEAEVEILSRSDYARYLPAVFVRDEVMGRFLSLFESFWRPIDLQIESLPFYFDPALAPPEFLHWLASWIDLALDDRWPLDRRRALLRSAFSIYRKRGTRQGLQEYLEIYTGGQVQIVEHRAENLRLGSGVQLGSGLALGGANQPHTFTVRLRLPPTTAPSGGDGIASLRRVIESIVEAEKPAHTRYTLYIEDAE
jgi:phage tail-like protein